MSRQLFSSNAKWEETVGYSRAVRVGPFIFVSGTTATNEQGEIIGINDAYTQSLQIWKNIRKVLERAGSRVEDIVRTRMFVVNIDNNAHLVSKAHHEVFKDIRPACTMVGVAALYVPEMLVEFEVDAVISKE